MRLISMMFIPALLVAGPASADARACTAQWEWLTGLAEVEAESRFTPAAVSDTACRVRGVKASASGEALMYEIDAITWDIRGIDSTMADRTPPTAATLSVENLRFVPQTGDNALDYLFRAQQLNGGLDLDLSINWDQDSRELRLERLVVDFPGDDHLSLSGRIEGIDLSSESSAAMSIGGAGLTRLDLEIVSKGLFENFILLPLGMPLLENAENPEAEVSLLKGQISDRIKTLPPAIFSTATRTALQDILTDLPNPWGEIALQFESDTGFGMAQILAVGMSVDPLSPDAIAAMFDGATIDITYERHPRP